MSAQLKYRQQLAADYRRWLDTHTPEQTAPGVWKTMHKLWQLVQDDLQQMTERELVADPAYTPTVAEM